jgi:predicted transcriptional regulator
MWLLDHFRIAKRLTELEHVIAQLDRDFRELYDTTAALQERCHREMKRTLMERARMEKLAPSGGEAPAAEETIGSSGRFTSPNQLAALSAIRARRNGGL